MRSALYTVIVLILVSRSIYTDVQQTSYVFYDGVFIMQVKNLMDIM